MHDKLKMAVGIETANCGTCAYRGTDDDGNFPEHAISWHVCTKSGREHVSNLKSFPFAKEQPCWEPEFWCSSFAEKIKTGTREEVDALFAEFLDAINNAANGGKE